MGGDRAWSPTLQHGAVGFSFCLIAAQGFLLHRAISRRSQIPKAAVEEMVMEAMQPLPLAARGCAPASHSPALSTPGLASQCTSPVLSSCAAHLPARGTVLGSHSMPSHCKSPTPPVPDPRQPSASPEHGLKKPIVVPYACPTRGVSNALWEAAWWGRAEAVPGMWCGCEGVCAQRMGHGDGARSGCSALSRAGCSERDARGLQRGEAVRQDGVTRRQNCFASDPRGAEPGLSLEPLQLHEQPVLQRRPGLFPGSTWLWDRTALRPLLRVSPRCRTHTGLSPFALPVVSARVCRSTSQSLREGLRSPFRCVISG